MPDRSRTLGDIDVIDLTDQAHRRTNESATPLRQVTWVDREKQALLWSIPKRSSSRDPWPIRLGIAVLLIVNGVLALTDPQEFGKLLDENVVAGRFSGDAREALVTFAGVNDLALAAFVLSGKWRRTVYLWLALWFAVIAATKASNYVL